MRVFSPALIWNTKGARGKQKDRGEYFEIRFKETNTGWNISEGDVSISRAESVEAFAQLVWLELRHCLNPTPSSAQTSNKDDTSLHSFALWLKLSERLL